jgi:flagellar export protein FliJ
MAQSFRLATLLKLREQTRAERRRELAQAFEAERILRDRAAQLQADIEATRERTRRSARGSVNVEDLLHARRYELTVKGELAEVDVQIAQVLQEIERRRQSLLEADRDVKVMEKLRELQAAQQAAVEQQRENRQLDEAGLRGYARRQEATR